MFMIHHLRTRSVWNAINRNWTSTEVVATLYNDFSELPQTIEVKGEELYNTGDTYINQFGDDVAMVKEAF